MGTLKSMIEFILETEKILERINEKLDKIQNHFNTNFFQVKQARLAEIGFLQKEFFARPDLFPRELQDLYNEQVVVQEAEFRKNFAALTEKRKKMEESLDEAEKERISLIQKIKSNNARLDNREEKLKTEVARLEADIIKYNKKIDEMSTGFGFLVNLFAMRRIQSDKNSLLEERDRLAEEIEDIRVRWQEKFSECEDEEQAVQDKWSTRQVELAVADEKVASLEQGRTELIRRAAFMGMLDHLNGDEPFLQRHVSKEKATECGRCSSNNSDNYFFCRYCGYRFSEDRMDVGGSLVEVGELNEVYENYQEGIKEAVSFLALVRGLSQGAETFRKSVQTTKESQDKYSALPELNIDVPQEAVLFKNKLEKLNENIVVKYLNLHPREFAAGLGRFMEQELTNERIEGFFTVMGEELDRRTREQW